MNIYLQNEIDFVHNGLGFLTDVLKANVTDNLNGDYYLFFEYKIDGNLSEYLENENIVKCQVSDGSKQLFIIKSVIKTFNSIQVTAKHIFYQLLDNFIEDTAPTNLSCPTFLSWILDKTNYAHPFKGYSDISLTKSARYVRRNPVDCILGKSDNSMVNLFKGEIKRDNFNIYFNKQIGNDNGVKLTVGKNITGINISKDTNSVHTRIMPQGFNGLLLPEKYVDSPLINNYTYPKVYKAEFSDIKYNPEDSNSYQTEEEAFEALRASSRKLFEDGIDKPTINVKVDWIELSKTNEYKNFSNLEKVSLGDVITIDLLGVSYKSRIIKTIYNPLTDKIESFEIGSPKANIGTSTNDIQRQLEEINSNNFLQDAIDAATSLITNALKGYVYKTQGELFVMDTDNPSTATRVWRWNLNGLGYSKSGIDGPYELAMTMDGSINASLITSGILKAIGAFFKDVTIEGGKITLKDDGTEESASLVIESVREIEINIREVTDLSNKKILLDIPSDINLDLDDMRNDREYPILVGENDNYIYLIKRRLGTSFLIGYDYELIDSKTGTVLLSKRVYADPDYGNDSLETLDEYTLSDDWGESSIYFDSDVLNYMSVISEIPRYTYYTSKGIVADLVTDENYTMDDLTTIQQIATSGTPPTKEQLKKYDLNNDGKINISDLLIVQKYLLAGISKNKSGKFILNTDSLRDNLQILDGDGNQIVSIGLNGISAKSISVEGKNILYVKESGQNQFDGGVYEYRLYNDGYFEADGIIEEHSINPNSGATHTIQLPYSLTNSYVTCSVNSLVAFWSWLAVASSSNSNSVIITGWNNNTSNAIVDAKISFKICGYVDAS